MDSTGALSVPWSSDPCDVDHIATQLEFPQLAKLSRDLYDAGGTRILSRGAPVKLHGLKTFQKIELSAVDKASNAGERFLVPVNSSETIQILPFREKNFTYPTVGDLINEIPRPKAVVVNRKITLYEKNYTINAGETLIISSVDKRCTSAGVVDFLLCRHHEKMIGLPTSCAGDFTAVPDETRCAVSDLGKACDFPQRVKFAGLSSAALPAHCAPGVEYIAQGVVRRQYLICTDARGADPEGDRMYFIPLAVGRPQGNGVSLYLPLSRDSAARRLLDAGCDNLSMKHVVDCTPLVERSHSGEAFARTFNEAYDAPIHPRTCRPQPPSYGAGQATANYEEPYYAAPSSLRQVTSIVKPHGGNIISCNASSASDVKGLPSVALSRAASFGVRTNDPGPPRPEVPKSVSFGGTSTAKTKSTSIKKSRKSAISSAVTRLLLSPSSSDEEGTSNGHHVASAESYAADPSAIYENGQIAASSIIPVAAPAKPVGKTKPIMKLPRAPPETATIKELWTLPSSPDYRDHTTPAFSSLAVTDRDSKTSQPAYAMSQHRASEAGLQEAWPRQLTQAGRSTPPLSKACPQSPGCRNRRGSCALAVFDAESPAKLSLAAPTCANMSSRPPSALSVASGGSSSSGHGSCADSSTDVSCSPSHQRRSHRRSASADSIVTLTDVPDDLSGLSVTALSACLQLHELHAAAEKLRQQQVDGHVFMMMTEAMFRDQAFGLSDFEVLKIRRLQSGWRPKIK